MNREIGERALPPPDSQDPAEPEIQNMKDQAPNKIQIPESKRLRRSGYGAHAKAEIRNSKLEIQNNSAS